MKYDHLTCEVDEAAHIATVTLNKPERLNAIDQFDHRDILDVCRRLREDESVWIVIWTGAGKGFCAGADIRPDRLPEVPEPLPLSRIVDDGTWVSRQTAALMAIDRPMIAAVNGVAAGAGFCLALCCDIRVGCENSRFVTVFQERGLPPEGGLSFLLPRVVGLGRALDLSLTSRRVDAEEAYRIGLLDRLVPATELMSTARSVAGRICELPPAAVRVTRRALYWAAEHSLEESTHYETFCGPLATRAVHDREESLKAFQEKRKPEYRGN